MATDNVRHNVLDLFIAAGDALAASALGSEGDTAPTGEAAEQWDTVKRTAVKLDHDDIYQLRRRLTLLAAIVDAIDPLGGLIANHAGVFGAPGSRVFGFTIHHETPAPPTPDPEGANNGG